MTLWISENAVIRAIQDSAKIQNYYEARFQGEYFTKYFLFGNKVDNSTITGGGAIDGNAVDGYRVSPKSMRPVLLGFINSQNVKVTNLDLLNSDSWCFIPQKSDGVIIDGINLYSPHKDGIAPMDCNNVTIANSVLSCGDDAIVPKSYDPSRGLDNLVVKNVTINHTRWKGFKYGAATKGDFSNSLFEDMAMVYTHSGLALYAMSGCNVTNIRFNRIKMNNVQTPFFILRSATGSPNTTGMQDIYISNIEVRNVYSQQGSSIQGTEKDGKVYPIKNIYLTNVDVNSFRGGLEDVPEMPPEFPGSRPRISQAFPDGYPETIVWDNFPAWGYFIRHAENVVFTNVTYDVSPEDAREAIILEDVTEFETINKENR
jgi:polygalacturonase